MATRQGWHVQASLAVKASKAMAKRQGLRVQASLAVKAVKAVQARLALGLVFVATLGCTDSRSLVD